MEILTTDTTQTETGPDRTTMQEEILVSVLSVLLRETRESKVDLSSSPEDKNPAGPPETEWTLGLLLPLTETGSIGTETRTRWFAGTNPPTPGPSPAT